MEFKFHTNPNTTGDNFWPSTRFGAATFLFCHYFFYHFGAWFQKILKKFIKWKKLFNTKKDSGGYSQTRVCVVGGPSSRDGSIRIWMLLWSPGIKTVLGAQSVSVGVKPTLWERTIKRQHVNVWNVAQISSQWVTRKHWGMAALPSCQKCDFLCAD